MSAATCPACGVSVMPGYVRCPNKQCRKPLPRRAAAVQGGTALEEAPRRWPLLAVLGVGVVGVAVIAYLGTRTKDAPAPAVAEAAPVVAPTATPEEPASTPPAFADDPGPQQAAGPDPTALAASLDRELKRQRLWSTVSVIGSRVDVRSGSCGDPAILPLLDAAVPGFKAAGLTKLRCVEQSGRVVSDRDL